jgi:hypothetical protein
MPARRSARGDRKPGLGLVCGRSTVACIAVIARRDSGKQNVQSLGYLHTRGAAYRKRKLEYVSVVRKSISSSTDRAPDSWWYPQMIRTYPCSRPSHTSATAARGSAARSSAASPPGVRTCRPGSAAVGCAGCMPEAAPTAAPAQGRSGLRLGGQQLPSLYERRRLSCPPLSVTCVQLQHGAASYSCPSLSVQVAVS